MTHMSSAAAYLSENVRATILPMILPSYDLIPPEQCLCVSISVVSFFSNRGYREIMVSSQIPLACLFAAC